MLGANITYFRKVGHHAMYERVEQTDYESHGIAVGRSMPIFEI